MSQYLLLRDNKQSGPYTFEELTSKGLKGYDLIWIEGKSAAWRYPSEIPEFKPFAPVVEEQPYDRFYKRQNSTVSKQQATASTTGTSNTPAAAATNSGKISSTDTTADNQQAKKNYNNATATNRRVVVILPGGMRENNNTERVVFHETVENKIAQPEKKIANTKEPVSATLAPVTERIKDPAIMEFRKEPAAEVRNINKDKGILSSKTPKILASTLVLLTIGVIIGWAFSNTFTERKTVTPPATPTETVQIPASQSVFNNEASQSVENQVSTAENELIDQAVLQDANQLAADTMVLSVPAETAVLKKPVMKPKKQVAISDNEQLPMPVAQQPEITTSTESTVSNADNEEAEKRSVKKNISELIKVSKNDFKIGAFGGISNLQLKVTNNSPYPVDLVVVEVKYLLANKKEFKTENVYFKNLAPGASVSKEAPKSSRGIEVASKVALITSKALGMYQASL